LNIDTISSVCHVVVGKRRLVASVLHLLAGSSGINR
jgi:hypothetical protein